MTSNGVGWHFPPTSGGTYDGYNDLGIAHFDGAHEESLARETLQNSLDAREGEKPVEVEFLVTELDVASLGHQELRQAVTACLAEPELSDKAKVSLAKAKDLLSQSRLKALQISDWNTTGLRGHQWTALVKARGMSVKQGSGSGGSHGIGKFAPFVVSPLRTVFYWTRFQDGDQLSEFFQGRSVLMSHTLDGVEKQGTGYYGRIHKCQKLRGQDIPSTIRPNDDRSGTTLWIAGYPDDHEWQRRIAGSVLTSFFGSIEDGALAIWIDSASSQEMEQKDLAVIDKESIGRWFEYLALSGNDTEDRSQEIMQSRSFWELFRDNPVSERQLPDVGYCRLWVRVEEGLPSKVGLMRKNGMLVTTNQPRLQRFRGLNDFMAICRFEGEEGNELLRRMENPTHDRFEPDRLPLEERRRGRAALKRIADWIRSELRELAGPPPYDDSIDLPELWRLLPDIEPEDSFGNDQDSDESNRELQFGGAPIVTLKPRRRASQQSSVEGEGDGGVGGDLDEGDDDDGRNGSHVNNGNGNGHGGGGGGGRSSRRERLGIEDVRFIRTTSGAYRVSFTPLEDGLARIDIREAGDSSSLARPDVRAYVGKRSISLSKLVLEKNMRQEFDIVADDPIADRAWVVSAVKIDS